MTSIYQALAGSPTPNSISKGVSKSRVTPDSYHSTLSLRDNHDRVFSSRVTPDSYHSQLSLRDNMTVCFHLLSNITFRPTLRASYIHGSLTPTQKFRISLRVSYTHIEISDNSTGLLHPHRISDNSTGLLHPHRNLGSLLGSLTPTQKFGISPRVSYTHTEIRDVSPGLLHPHRTFRILPRVSFTLTPGFSP